MDSITDEVVADLRTANWAFQELMFIDPAYYHRGVSPLFYEHPDSGVRLSVYPNYGDEGLSAVVQTQDDLARLRASEPSQSRDQFGHAAWYDGFARHVWDKTPRATLVRTRLRAEERGFTIRSDLAERLETSFDPDMLRNVAAFRREAATLMNINGRHTADEMEAAVRYVGRTHGAEFRGRAERLLALGAMAVKGYSRWEGPRMADLPEGERGAMDRGCARILERLNQMEGKTARFLYKASTWETACLTRLEPMILPHTEAHDLGIVLGGLRFLSEQIQLRQTILDGPEC